MSRYTFFTDDTRSNVEPSEPRRPANGLIMGAVISVGLWALTVVAIVAAAQRIIP